MYESVPSDSETSHAMGVDLVVNSSSLIHVRVAHVSGTHLSYTSIRKKELTQKLTEQRQADYTCSTVTHLGCMGSLSASEAEAASQKS